MRLAYDKETGRNTKISPYMNNNESDGNYLIIRSNSKRSRRRSNRGDHIIKSNRSSSEPKNNGELETKTLSIPVISYGKEEEEEIDFKREASFDTHMNRLKEMNDNLKFK